MLREQKSVLIVPGDHFGMDGYLRIGFGDDVGYLRNGLNRLDALLSEVVRTSEVRLQPDTTHDGSETVAR